MNLPRQLRVVCIFAVIVATGCTLEKNPLQYIGDSNDLEDAATPSGFSVSPLDARDIMRSHQLLKKTADDYYHNGENYFVVDVLVQSDASDKLVRSNASTAQQTGTIINGQTGQIFNRETQSWEPDPRSNEEK